MSEMKLIRCRCALTPGGPRVIEPETICPVPHDRWLLRPGVTPIAQPYPCRCGRSCSPQWCECAGRIDLENVGPDCCAHRHTPEVVAKAIHGSDYRTCWCKGDLAQHKTRNPTITALPGLETDDEDEETD